MKPKEPEYECIMHKPKRTRITAQQACGNIGTLVNLPKLPVIVSGDQVFVAIGVGDKIRLTPIAEYAMELSKKQKHYVVENFSL